MENLGLGVIVEEGIPRSVVARSNKLGTPGGRRRDVREGFSIKNITFWHSLSLDKQPTSDTFSDETKRKLLHAYANGEMLADVTIVSDRLLAEQTGIFNLTSQSASLD